MGLQTKACTPSAYQHGNALAENAIQRIRGLAGSLMHSLQLKLGVTINSNHALWTWCMRHAAWILNRFNPHQGLTAFEVVYGKAYHGQVCEFGEPVLGYAKTPYKGNPKWQRMLFVGKVEGQDSFLLYTGSGLILTRSVRRIKTNWTSYMAFYKQFDLFSWQYKVGFGGRVQPTKRKVNPRSVSFTAPIGPFQPSSLVDEDAEAVKAKAQEEKNEEGEQERMAGHDKPAEIQREVQFGDGRIFEETEKPRVAYAPQPVVMPPPSTAVPAKTATEDAGSSSVGGDPLQSVGMEVPMTPDVHTGVNAPASPRHSSTTREHADEGETAEAKRARVEEHKKPRINKIEAHVVECEKAVRTVQFGMEEYYTMDEYEAEWKSDDSSGNLEEVWLGEDELYFAGTPESVWSDWTLKEQPPPPDPAVDLVADEIEIDRLLEMKVLVKPEDHQGRVEGRLTTKFVRDWRKKLYVSEGQSRERWMRRSRLVAREYAVEKRDDTFSPATGAHTSNLLPLLHLQRQAEGKGSSDLYKPLLASLDIKDAFLQVPQTDPIQVFLNNTPFIILKNLPGQRQGSKAWYWYFRTFLEENLQFTFCAEQPCLAKCDEATVLMHVDDLLYAGTQEHFHNVFLKKCKEKFSVSHAELDEPGSSITFLKKRLVQLDDGILVTPGTDVEKLVESFEEKFGRARISSVPCDNSIQLEDTSHALNVEDSTHFRSIVGSALYLGRDRPDTIFCIKELAGKMPKPTLMALQHLRKLIGYLKGTGNLGVKLCNPTPGHGKWKVSEEAQWVLETFSDADWAANRSHRRSTSCGVHFLNGNYLYSSSRTQKVISLSSCESELHSIVSAMCDCLFIRRCLEFMLGTRLLQVHFTDSSSARQLVSRQGVGKVRHLAGKILWVQSKVREGDVLLSQISTSFNISDVGTKPLSKKRLVAMMGEIGMMHVESGETVGEMERDELRTHGSNSKSLSKIAKTVLKLTAMMGLEPMQVAAQEETCNETNQKDSSFWIWTSLMVLACAWMAVCFIAFWVWKKLDKRLYWNEVQLAEDDSMLGRHRDQLSTLQDQLTNLRGKFERHVERYDGEFEVLEDYGDSIRFGLVEIGGFVRHRKLTTQQRESLQVLEKANMAIFDQNKKTPENTDPPRKRSATPTRSSCSESKSEQLEAGDEGNQLASGSAGTVDGEEAMSQLENLLNNLRAQQNESLANELYEDAREFQRAIDSVLEAKETGAGLTADLLFQVRNCFQRVFRKARNRGEEWLSQVYKFYVDDMQQLLK